MQFVRSLRWRRVPVTLNYWPYIAVWQLRAGFATSRKVNRSAVAMFFPGARAPRTHGPRERAQSQATAAPQRAADTARPSGARTCTTHCRNCATEIVKGRCGPAPMPPRCIDRGSVSKLGLTLAAPRRRVTSQVTPLSTPRRPPTADRRAADRRARAAGCRSGRCLLWGCSPTAPVTLGGAL